MGVSYRRPLRARIVLQNDLVPFWSERVGVAGDLSVTYHLTKHLFVRLHAGVSTVIRRDLGRSARELLTSFGLALGFEF